MKPDRVVDSCPLPSLPVFPAPAAHLHPACIFPGIKAPCVPTRCRRASTLSRRQSSRSFSLYRPRVTHDRQIRFSIYPSFSIIAPAGQPRAYRTCPRSYKMIVFARGRLFPYCTSHPLRAAAREMIEYQDVLVSTVPRGTFSASADYIYFPENSFPLLAAV